MFRHNVSKRVVASLLSVVLVVLLLLNFFGLSQTQVSADAVPTATPGPVSTQAKASATISPTQTITPTVTITPTQTITPTVTITPTQAITPTLTVAPAKTLTGTVSPAITITSSTVVTSTPGVGTSTATATPALSPAVPVLSDTPAATPTPDPDEAAKQKEKEEKEKAKQEALSKARNYVFTVGQPSPAAIDNWLARCNSPQLLEGTPDKTIGQIYLELGWKYGINPAYALAFFTKESSCGTAGSNLAAHNFGNIRWTTGYPTLDQVWRAYPNWTAGMEDWFRLLHDNYLRPEANTLADVLPIYAPDSENDTTLYMNQVMAWVDTIMAGSPDSKINLTNSQYFEATGFRVGWDFLNYWRTHGAETSLGWPIANQEYEQGQIVQYFERGVLEFHPENAASSQVMLRSLGRVAGKAQPSAPLVSNLSDGSLYFPQTGHRISGQFAKTWQSMGGVARFGYPLAEPETQGTQLVQWFERTRFVIDLQQATPQVQLAPVGREALDRKLEKQKQLKDNAAPAGN